MLDSLIDIKIANPELFLALAFWIARIPKGFHVYSRGIEIGMCDPIGVVLFDIGSYPINI